MNKAMQTIARAGRNATASEKAPRFGGFSRLRYQGERPAEASKPERRTAIFRAAKLSRLGVAILALTLILAAAGCAGTPFGGPAGALPAGAAPTVAAPAPSPTPVIVSTPASEPAAAGGAGRRLAVSAMTYNGEILAETIVPVVAQVGGQIEEVRVKVGAAVRKGDVVVRIDSAVFEAQRAQAQAALELTQAQLELAKTQPKKSDLDAAQAAINAARAGYNRALQGPTEEEKRMALAQLRQAEAAVKVYQGQYDRIAGNPFSAMMMESLQLQQATLMLEAAQAQYDKVQKGATADVIAGAYAQMTGAEAQLARLQRGAEPAQIKAAEAGVKQAEVAVYLAQLQLQKATIEAPADGFIYKLDAVQGGMAGPGTALMVIFSDEVKIVIPVQESRGQDVRVGQAATIRVDAFGERTFEGKVSAIAPTFDHATRTVQVTVKPTGEGAKDLRPGMFATVTLLEK
jgi:multidrug resistance efflux pump